MNLDRKYWSYCKEIGIMKENCTHQAALQCLIKAVNGIRTADPAFKSRVSSMTLSSPEVSIRSCMLYRYDIDLDYVVRGQLKHGHIGDFGNSGAPSGLAITSYAGDGSYTKLTDFSSVPYAIFNSHNLFTHDQIKGALKDVINKKVPSGTTSYESTNWSVSAYVVPVLVIKIVHNGKTYEQCYNLQNNKYTYCWPDDPALIQQGINAGKTSMKLRVVSFAIAVISLFAGLFSAESGPLPLVLPILILIGLVIYTNKTKKSKNYYERFFFNNYGKKPSAAYKPAIFGIVLSVFSLILAIVL